MPSTYILSTNNLKEAAVVNLDENGMREASQKEEEDYTKKSGTKREASQALIDNEISKVS